MMTEMSWVTSSVRHQNTPHGSGACCIRKSSAFWLLYPVNMDRDSDLNMDNGYIPMQSVRSFRMFSEERHENIYENPKKYQKFNCIRKVYQIGKQVWGPILCLALPCSVLLVIVLLLAKNSAQSDELHQKYINLTRERETLKLKLYQLGKWSDGQRQIYFFQLYLCIPKMYG